MRIKRLRLFFLTALVIGLSAFNGPYAWADLLDRCNPDDFTLRVTVMTADGTAAGGTVVMTPGNHSIPSAVQPAPATATFSIEPGSFVSLTVNPAVSSMAGPYMGFEFAEWRVNGTVFVPSGDPLTYSFAMNGDVNIETRFRPAVQQIVVNSSNFSAQQLPNGHTLITVPSELSRSDQVLVVKGTSASAPGQPDFNFVKGDAVSFTLKIIPSSAQAPALPAAFYVVERFSPSGLPRPEDGQPEDIGQAFSPFATGEVTATGPIPAGSLTDGTYTVAGLNAGKDYCFRVKALTQNGLESVPSKSKCGRTLSE